MTENLSLGIPAMDETHDEFMQLLSTAQTAKGADFLTAFEAMLHHTEVHFAMEEALMREHGFYGIQEHFDEHQTLLEEMRYFYQKAQKAAAFGRAYIDQYAFDKFHRHVINIDSQLAMFLKTDTTENTHV